MRFQIYLNDTRMGWRGAKSHRLCQWLRGIFNSSLRWILRIASLRILHIRSKVSSRRNDTRPGSRFLLLSFPASSADLNSVPCLRLHNTRGSTLFTLKNVHSPDAFLDMSAKYSPPYRDYLDAVDIFRVRRMQFAPQGLAFCKQFVSGCFSPL